MERAAALESFDRARDRFLEAMEQAPDESLTYLREGDIYAVGGLLVHCNQVLRHYHRVLERLTGPSPAGFRAEDPEEEVATADRRALAGLTGAERKGELEALASLHAAVTATSSRVPEGGWELKTPVVYGGTPDPYPTSPDDVVGWLRDHYEEHVPHAAELVGAWRASNAR